MHVHVEYHYAFYRAHPCAQHTNTQIMLHAISIATGCIYAVPVDNVAG